MDLTPTARVLLGMLRLGKRSGYEIKQLVDVSIRFFWTASYGQIYPELKRLEQQGLIESEGAPEGGRRRRSYRLTKSGEQALDGWLASNDDLTLELRDEGLLKLFFSDSMAPDQKVELIRSMRAHHQEVLDTLTAIEPGARQAGGGPLMTLRYGLRLHGSMVDLCDELERELSAELARR